MKNVQLVLPFPVTAAETAPAPVTFAAEQLKTAVEETPVDRLSIERRSGTDWDEIARILGYSRSEVDEIRSKMRFFLRCRHE